MFNLLSGLRGYLKRQEIITDNSVFRLHCTLTTVLLLTFSMIVTWTQFVGQPIRCIATGIPHRVINTYCWIITTFTVPDAFHRPPETVAHPGIANNYNDESNQKYYNYYQWVCFILFFQALMCYFPKWLWEFWEKGFMKTIVCGLNVGLQTEEDKKIKMTQLVNYLIRNLNYHNFYAFRYWFCEFLCLVNVIFQMFLMNWFFNGDFMAYGFNVLTFDDQDQENRHDNMIYVFPRVTKCTFRRFGPTGTVEKHDAICVLPLNIINEKTYVFLWFWFILVAILLGFLLIFRAIVILKPSLRPILMNARNYRLLSADVTRSVTKKVSVGDWWVLYMLGRNMDPPIYKEVIDEFVKQKDANIRQI